MFGWFKKKPPSSPSDDRVARINALYAAVQGPHIQRSCIAVAMFEIESDLIQSQLPKLPAEKRNIYVMTYACYLMWAIERGLKEAVNAGDTAAVISAMQGHFAKSSWCQPSVLAMIWDKMQLVMPMALNPTPEAVIYPAAEMVMAADLAGYPLSSVIDTDIKIGMQISMKLGQVVKFAHAVAKE